jgi:hypothetical protein
MRKNYDNFQENKVPPVSPDPLFVQSPEPETNCLFLVTPPTPIPPEISPINTLDSGQVQVKNTEIRKIINNEPIEKSVHDKKSGCCILM